MRPIKFRAWDKIEKQWAKAVGIVFLRLDGTIFENEFQGFIDPSDRYEVMQLTGLLDAKGREIYEGDIVRLAGYGDYVVEWPFIQLFESSFEKDIEEILGNIHEHPGLLKEAK
jgi:hypothetical protein